MEVLEELELRAALADILEVADIVVAHGSLVELGEGDLAVVVKHHVQLALVAGVAPAAAVPQLGVIVIALDQALVLGLRRPVDQLALVVLMPGAQPQPSRLVSHVKFLLMILSVTWTGFALPGRRPGSRRRSGRCRSPAAPGPGRCSPPGRTGNVWQSGSPAPGQWGFEVRR